MSGEITRQPAPITPAAPGSLVGRAFRRMLAFVRRASDRVFAALVVALLAVVYVLVLPWFALARRLSGPPPAGWQARDDRGVASRERLRRMF